MRERETLLRLARAGEYRDEETGNHVIRMAKYSRVIAEHLGFSKDEAEVIEMAAPMHDIGKIGIRDDILLKPGKLTSEEFEIMKDHTKIGYDILKDSPSKFLQMGASSHLVIMRSLTVQVTRTARKVTTYQLKQELLP